MICHARFHSEESLNGTAVVHRLYLPSALLRFFSTCDEIRAKAITQGRTLPLLSRSSIQLCIFVGRVPLEDGSVR